MSRLSSLSDRAKYALLAGAVLLLLVVGWFAVVSPKRSEAAKVQSQIDDTQAQIDARRAALHAPPSSEPSIRVADLFKLSRAMPNQADMPDVLLELSRVAHETGVQFQSITPHDPVQQTAYQQVGIDLVFQGRFYDLSDFLYRLRNLVSVRDGVLTATGRLFTVNSISFSQGSHQFPQVQATLNVSAYVFGDGTGAAVPGTASAAQTTTGSSEGTQPVPAAPAGASAAGA